MGQCVSAPDKDRTQQPRQKLSTIRSSLRQRTATYRERHQAGRPKETVKREDQSRRVPVLQPESSRPQAPNVHTAVDTPVAATTSYGRSPHAITQPTEGDPVLSTVDEAPIPPVRQDDQAYNEQEENVTTSPDPSPDEFPADFNKQLFQQELAKILEAQMVAKDEAISPNLGIVVSDGTRGNLKQDMKKVTAESMQLEDPATSMGKMEHDASSQLSPLNVQSSSGQQPSSEVPLFKIQNIEESEFQKGGKVGAGRSGLVHLAQWYGAQVAIKEFYGPDPSENERAMHQESKTLSILKHPTVVSLYGVSFYNNHHAIVLEYVAGGSLRSQLLQIRRDRRLSSQLTLRVKTHIALQAAYAMEYLHSRNIIHFDIKAENFLCDLRDIQHPIVKVADVGLSKHKLAAFVTGTMRGTLPWMAPELFPRMPTKETANQGYIPTVVTYKVDVYSFAIVLWEIWNVGAEPYPNMSAADVLYRVLGGSARPEISDDCPRDWQYLMQLCWTQNPDHRPTFPMITRKLEAMLRVATS